MISYTIHSKHSKHSKLLRLICLCSALAYLAAPSLSFADSAKPSDQPKDYSHSMLLDLRGKSGVMALRLPQNFYLHAQSPQLADMRLFDSEGKKVAFALHQPQLASKREQFTLPSKIFPLHGAQELRNADAAIEMEVKRNAQGVVTSAKIKNNDGQRGGSGENGENGELQALLLDFGLQNQGELPYIDSLQLQLPSTKSDYTAQVWLAVSDDLQRWETIAASDLRWLVNQQGEHLVQDSIQFEGRRFRYARLSWGSGKALQFASVTARGSSHAIVEPALESMLLTAEKGKFAQDLQYVAAAALPVEKISLQFTNPNVVLPVQIGSYRQLPAVKAGQTAKWEFIAQHRNVFYQIQQNGQTRRSAEMQIPISHFGTWVIRGQDDAPIPSEKVPQLKISWQAASVIFLASGKGPYQLSFGRDNVNSGHSELGLVAPNFSIEELSKLEHAKVSAVQINPHYIRAGDDATAKLGESAQQRSYLLWAVLLAGVAVMGGLVLRLMKQMQSAAPK